MRKIETTVYKFDELSDSAKENAREWWRNCETFDDPATIDDAKEVGRILGIEIDSIYYNGFHSQGDGACFTGRYSYAKGASKAIREYAPNDTCLHVIADALQQLQRKAFYRIEATMYHRGRYYHSGCMQVDSDNDDIVQIMRGFADWIYRQLESEYEYLMSDENIDACICINEYEFGEEGNLI